MNLGSWFFKNRSYTPIPFVIVLLLYCNPNVLSVIIGLIFVLIGEAIRIWANGWVGSETRATANVGASKLIISGPYAYVRNPLYIGNIFIYLGLGIMSNALFPYFHILALAFFIFQYSLIIKEEEKFLLNKFGQQYQKYLSNVKRFIPSFKKYNDSDNSQPTFDLKEGLRTERRSIQAWLIIALMIILILIIRRI